MSDPEFLILGERDRDGSLSDFGAKNVLHVPIAHLQAVINHSQTENEVFLWTKRGRETRPIAISRVLLVQKYSQKCTEVSQKVPLSHR